MEKLKLILLQTVIINFFIQIILVIGSIISRIKGLPYEISWYIPGSIVLISFLSSIPSLMFYSNRTITRKTAKIKIIIHYLLLLALVGTGGRIFYWYTEPIGFLQFAISFTVIYILVWYVMALRQKHDEKLINDALNRMRDED